MKKIKIKQNSAIIVKKAEGKENNELYYACEQLADSKNAINYFSQKYRIATLRFQNALIKAHPGIEKYLIDLEQIEEGKHIIKIGEKVKKK